MPLPSTNDCLKVGKAQPDDGQSQRLSAEEESKASEEGPDGAGGESAACQPPEQTCTKGISSKANLQKRY